MFDSPRITLDEKRLFLLDDDPVVNISVGKKPNSLPPLKADPIVVDRSPITRRGKDGGSPQLASLNNKNGVRSSRTVNKTTTTGHLTSKTKKTSTTTSTKNEEILHADVYEHLIKSKIDANKNKLNDFDALCANLMQRREEERNTKKTKHLNNKFDNQQHEESTPMNALRRTNTFDIIDKNNEIIKPIDLRKKPVAQSPRTEQKTSTRPERPKTSYGRRRRHAEER